MGDEALFPMVQRYENESKSQHNLVHLSEPSRCFQWFKDTKMKANHNKRKDYEKWKLAVSNGSKILK